MSYIAIAVAAPAPAAAWMRAELEPFSDRVEHLPPDRWLLNAGGMEGVLGPAGEIAHQVEARLRSAGLEARLGVAGTRSAALLRTQAALPPEAGSSSSILIEPRSRWSRCGRNSLAGGGCPPCSGHLRAAANSELAALPLEALRALDGCAGADGETVEVAALVDVLQRWGLRRLGELARLPRSAVAERLGATGITLRNWAQGKDDGLRPPATGGARPDPETWIEQEFEPALEGYLALLPWLEQELTAFCDGLEKNDRALQAIAIELTLLDRPVRFSSNRAPDGRAVAGIRSPAGRARPAQGTSEPPPEDRDDGPGGHWRWQQDFATPHRDPRRLLRQIENALAQNLDRPVRFSSNRAPDGRAVAGVRSPAGGARPAQGASEPPPAGGIRAARVRLSTGRPRRVQPGLFENTQAEAARDERLIARLGELLDLDRPVRFSSNRAPDVAPASKLAGGPDVGRAVAGVRSPAGSARPAQGASEPPPPGRIGSARLLDLHRSDAFAMVEFAPPARSSLPPAAPANVLCLRAQRPPASIELDRPVRFSSNRAPDVAPASKLAGGPDVGRAVAGIRSPAGGARPAQGTSEPPPLAPAGPAATGADWLSPAGARLRLRGGSRGGRGSRIRQAAGPWRSSGRWWAAAEGEAWSRDEWDVETEDGGLYLIAYDRRRRGWFLLGVYD